MIAHISFAVSDFERSKAFYRAVLAPLGYKVEMELTPETTGSVSVAGFGDGTTKYGDFYLASAPPGTKANTPMHVAFWAKSPAQVDAFYKAALESGGKDNGPPGPRQEYGPDDYVAFVLDPDGHRLEVWYMKPA
ncbi:VOC family protein [Pendulispora brunnea]|uniref:VOC family protein n=1 Tax=Pendulispora brunnea TaxID=2905690 RepID=A0ABZ2KDM2_9BACT